MARIYGTGFEVGSVGQFWSQTSAIVITTNTRGPWSRYSLRIWQVTVDASDILTESGVTEFYVGYGFHTDDFANSGAHIRFNHPDNTATQVSLRVNIAGAIEVLRGATTVLATSVSGLFSLSTWHYVEARFVISPSAGVAQVKVDGRTVIDSSGLNTRNHASSNLVGIIAYRAGAANNLFDDVVVNDTTGARNNSWPGEQKLQPVVPNATGDSNQLTPIGGTSVNRFYFPNNTPFPSPLSTLQPHAEWDLNTTNPLRALLAAGTPRSTTMATASSGNQAATVNSDVLVGQYVSKPLGAQTISGTVKMQARVQESTAVADARSQLILRVVSNDGSVVRGVLYAGNTGGLTSEWSSTALTNRKFPPDAPITLNNVTCQAGDRLVVEFGARTHAATGVTLTHRIGDSGGADLPEDETNTQDLNPWIEFSNAIAIAQSFNYDEVDEIPDDGDQTYVFGTSPGLRDLYHLSDISLYDAVDAITVWGRAKKSDAGAGGVKLPIKSGGTVSAGPELVIGTTYRYVRRVVEDDPAGGGWTPSAINALQAGVDTT